MAKVKPALGLALSGGGAKGAFQVGVLDYLVNDRNVDFRIIGGVSTGALQAMMAAQGEVKKLRQIWESIKDHRDIYTGRFGIIGGLLGADSLYSNNPLKEKIKKHINPTKIVASGRKLRIGVVSLQTGQYRLITEKDRKLRKWILASTAIPVYFEPVEIHNEQYVDGGIRDITPLGAVMHEKPDACLVVLASPLKMRGPRKAFPDLFEIGLRSVDIMVNEIYRNDLTEADWINNLLTRWQEMEEKLQPHTTREIEACLKPLRTVLKEYRLIPTHTIAPKKNVIDTLGFEPAPIREAIRHGREQAKAAWPELRKKFRL